MKISCLPTLISLSVVLFSPYPVGATEKAELFSVEQLRVAAAEVTSNIYADADAVLVAGWEQVRYNPDGTSRSLEDVCYKILTEKGRRDLRSLSFFYDIAYGTVIVTKLELIKCDGTVKPIDLAAQSRDMIDASQMTLNIYDPNLKTLNISVPGLELGDMVRYVAREFVTKARMPNTWADIVPLEDTRPIRFYRYEVLAPKARPLKHTALKNPIGSTVVYTQLVVQTGIVHRWIARDVPRIYPEPGMPGLNAIQHLLLSTIPDWPTVSRWYYSLSEPRLRAVTPAMSNLVKRLTAKASTAREKTEAIFAYVSQKIRYMGVTMEDTAPGYEPHDVCITFNNKYGVCRDKAALLVALLRIAGLKAYPVLIHFDIKKDPVVPEPYFNHAITAVEEADGSYLLMDSTDENTRELLPAYLNNKSYLVAKPQGDQLRTTPIVPARENLVQIDTHARYAPQGTLSLTSRLRFLGMNDNLYRGNFAQLDFDRIRRHFEGALKDVLPGASLTRFELQPDDMMDLSQPITVHLTCTAPDMLITGNRLTLVPLPWMGLRFGLLNALLSMMGLETRRYPLVTDIACGVREAITLDVGDATGPLVALPTYERIASDLLEWQRIISASASQLTATQLFFLHAVEFSTSQYAQLKSALRNIESEARKRPLFQRASQRDVPLDEESSPETETYEYVPAEDVQFIHISTTYTLSNASTWTVTEKVRKKVLTYAGKKQHAEIKVPYNPAWETVQLVNARVTDADGKEHLVTPKEINIMDAEWVGSAPRYPAGKILVVSFPAVDRDSEITYTIRRSCFNRPFFSAREYFTSFDPIEHKKVTVRLPDSLALTTLLLNKGELESTRTKRNGLTIYTWSTHDQRAVRREDDLPPWYSFNPTVLISAGSWKDYAALLATAFERCTSNQPAATARAAQLVAGVSTDEAKIRAIRDFVATHVRAAGPALDELPPSALSPADLTLNDGYGNSADRAILLVTLLRAAGFQPQFVLASASPRVPELQQPLKDCPLMSTFDRVLVRVDLNNQPIYLNDTDQYAALGATRHDGCLGLRLPDGDIELIRAARDKEDQSVSLYALTIEPDGTAYITQSNFIYGVAYGDVKRQFAEMQPEERRQRQEQMMADLAQSAQLVAPLSASFDSYPGTIALSVRVPRYAVRDGQRLYFTLPGDLTSLLRVRSDVRDNPYYWSEPKRAQLTISLQLPEPFTHPDIAPRDLTWSAPADAGTVRVSSSCAAATRSFTVHQEISLRPTVISPDDYTELLTVNRELAHPRMKTVLLTQPE
ncbi:MAG: DUF3857 domain-containing protein [bacterium]|nr:DUF3857 domain-containing protein [bacterium]